MSAVVQHLGHQPNLPAELPCPLPDLQVKAAFSGATASSLPDAPSLGPLSVDYNLATWEGNSTAYLTCNLDLRGPEYQGRCVSMPVTCTANPVDSRPYNCSRLSDGSVVSGNISNAEYR